MTEEHIIEVSDLAKAYGDLKAVDGISFHVNKGEVFAFLGPNGAGKTTTVEMIEMIREPTSGAIQIFGKNLGSNKSEVRERIGVLPQEFKSFERLTVKETLLYYQKLYDTKTWDVDEIIGLLDLEEKRNTLYMHLSGGLKQRVGVGIALVNDPEIVFLDEPTTGLDPKARRDVWSVIRLLRKKGKTVFLTTHYMEEAENLADRICIIHRGKIIARGTLEELITKYGRGIIVTIKGCDSEKVKAVANSMGLVSETSDRTCSFSVPDNQDILEFLTKLKDSQVPYIEVDIRRSNLEEIFLTLTGETLGGENNHEA
ncbi:MAG: ABC transporter ATP-binding protein [Candidatus Thermoplasmatota archaeon]|nr:ABC transporter ATP-binding protein [Candidatus Thermoplasmatota archaeon]